MDSESPTLQRRRPAFALAILAGLALGCGAEQIRADDGDTRFEFRSVRIQGQLPDDRDISAAASIDGLLFVGPDEGFSIQALARKAPDLYVIHSAPLELPPQRGEIDIEGMAASGDALYVIGSHSKKRKRMKPKATHEKNRKRMQVVETQDERNQLFRLTAGPEGWERPKVEKTSLSGVLARDPILQRFLEIPGKENGIDIEGIASRGEQLFIGFRGPVLRGNYVPVMKTTFDHPEHYELLFIDLGGRGIRSLASARDGFLIVAGPVGDGPGGYELYFWDGSDGIAAGNRISSAPRRIGAISVAGKPEGLAVLDDDDACVSAILFSDGPENGDPKLVDICV